MSVRIKQVRSANKRRYIQYVIEGRVYSLKAKNRDPVWYFSCATKNCSGTASVRWDDAEKKTGKVTYHRGHSLIICPENSACDSVAVTKLKKRILKRCKKENTKLRKLFNEERRREPKDVRKKLKFKAFKSTMWRTRMKYVPAIPNDLTHLEELIQQEVKRYGTVDGQQVFLGLKGNNGNSSIVYVNRDLLNVPVHEVHVDGTFKVRPAKPATSQLFTLLGMYHGVAIPIAFALMQSRRKKAHINVFEAIKEEYPAFKPKIFVSDFERGIKGAIKKCFPEAKHLGCWFHFAQALIHKARSLGISVISGWESKLVYMLIGSALLPANKIRDAFRLVKKIAKNEGLKGKMKPFFSYFKNYWMNIVTPEGFSVYGAINRTNNVQEGFHRRLNDAVDCERPNIWNLLTCLLDLFREGVSDFESLQDGTLLAPERRKNWELHDKAIRKKQQAFARGTCSLLEFLNVMCHRVPHHCRAETNMPHLTDELIVQLDLPEQDSSSDSSDEETVEEEEEGVDEEEEGVEEEEECVEEEEEGVEEEEECVEEEEECVEEEEEGVEGEEECVEEEEVEGESDAEEGEGEETSNVSISLCNSGVTDCLSTVRREEEVGRGAAEDARHHHILPAPPFDFVDLPAGRLRSGRIRGGAATRASPQQVERVDSNPRQEEERIHSNPSVPTVNEAAPCTLPQQVERVDPNPRQEVEGIHSNPSVPTVNEVAPSTLPQQVERVEPNPRQEEERIHSNPSVSTVNEDEEQAGPSGVSSRERSIRGVASATSRTFRMVEAAQQESSPELMMEPEAGLSESDPEFQAIVHQRYLEFARHCGLNQPETSSSEDDEQDTAWFEKSGDFTISEKEAYCQHHRLRTAFTTAKVAMRSVTCFQPPSKKTCLGCLKPRQLVTALPCNHYVFCEVCLEQAIKPIRHTYSTQEGVETHRYLYVPIKCPLCRGIIRSLVYRCN